MATDRSAILRAWAEARVTHPHNPVSIAARQHRLWRKMKPVLARTPALADLAGRPLEDFPIIDAHAMRADFDAWNSLGLTHDAVERAAQFSEVGGEGEVAPGVVAGFSTGSSGERGVFLTSRTERAEYLGHILARLLPADALMRRRRVALCLRADNQLYRDVRGAGPIEFRFFGLDITPDALADFAPNILIAPSGVLADLARKVRSGSASLPVFERVFYGAEPMDEVERGWIASALGARPDPIYQATEGFLGATCKHGLLHLNEDVLIVEREPVPGTTRFRPIVTDLRRTTQPMVRVRLDDLLEPIDALCPCGSSRQPVRGVEGRISDLWRWGDAVVTPREVADAVSRSMGAACDWRAIASDTQVRLEVVKEADAAQAAGALQSVLRRRQVEIPVMVAPFAAQAGSKRRRVTWRDG
ncbi:MAG TPA: cell division protein FtsA [Caulobacteraceae bacterium]|jgi:putative adenylate-forming enzyme|nr:cell division protein FtsA [Caulobacteraceae bacterium]